MSAAALRLTIVVELCLALAGCHGEARSFVQLDVQLEPHVAVTELRVQVQDAREALRFVVPEAPRIDEAHTVPLGFYLSLEAPADISVEISAWHEGVQRTEATTVSVLVKPGAVSRVSSPVRLQERSDTTSSNDAAADPRDGQPVADAGMPTSRSDGGVPCSLGIPCELPMVMSTSPARGETGVSPNAMLVVVFSQPMDKLSVKEAFSASGDIKLGPTSFAWNDAGDQLTVRPDDALPMAVGGPNVEAMELSFSLSSRAMSRQRVRLAQPMNVSFRTLRRITQSCPVIEPLSAMLYSSGPWSVQHFQVGTFDMPQSGKWATRTVLSFDCQVLPNAVRDLDQAVLNIHQTRLSPVVPFGIRLDHLRFDQLDRNLYDQPPLRDEVAYLSDVANGWQRVDVTAATRDDLTERVARHGRSQFRLSAAPELYSADGHSVGFGVTGERAPYLDVRYFAP